MSDDATQKLIIRLQAHIKESDELVKGAVNAVAKLQSDLARTRQRVQDCELALGLTTITKEKPPAQQTDAAILRNVQATIKQSHQHLERILKKPTIDPRREPEDD
jgi:hypothetical protein